MMKPAMKAASLVAFFSAIVAVINNDYHSAIWLMLLAIYGEINSK